VACLMLDSNQVVPGNKVVKPLERALATVTSLARYVQRSKRTAAMYLRIVALIGSDEV
jgi:hypothetical protein